MPHLRDAVGMAVWAAIALAAIAILVNELGSYQQGLFARQEAFLAAEYKVAHDCADAIATQRKGEVHLCREAQRLLRISPWISAMYDWFNRWLPCSQLRCDVWFIDLGWRLPFFAAAIGMLLIGLSCMGGLYVIRGFGQNRSALYLPVSWETASAQLMAPPPPPPQRAIRYDH
jgi:hypothetical protein